MTTGSVFLPTSRLISFPRAMRVRVERLGALLPDYERAALEPERKGGALRLINHALDRAIEQLTTGEPPERPPTGATLPADGLPTTEDEVPSERREP